MFSKQDRKHVTWYFKILYNKPTIFPENILTELFLWCLKAFDCATLLKSSLQCRVNPFTSHAVSSTLWKVSKYGVFFWSVFYLRVNTERYVVFSPNAGKYGPGKTPYLYTSRSAYDGNINELIMKGSICFLMIRLEVLWISLLLLLLLLLLLNLPVPLPVLLIFSSNVFKSQL